MRFEGYDDEIPDEDQVIEEVLGSNPRAREWRSMRAALEQRLDLVRSEQERADDPRARSEWSARVAELRRQIAALRQEEAITDFVEGSVRATLNQPYLDDMN